MPLISVLMPVHNREKLVTRAIESIKKQTIQDWELIILDDASTDRTLEICKELEKDDKRIHVYVNDKNLGVGQSRNRLISLATGEYIANHDSDDVSVTDRFEQQVKVLQSNPDIGLVSGLAAWVDENGRTLGYEPLSLSNGTQYPQDKEELIRMLFMKCEVSNPTCMYRRSINVSDAYGDYRVGEDWYFFLNIAHRVKIWGIQQVLVQMRRGSNHTHLWKDYKEGLEIIRKLRRDLYIKYKDDPESPISHALYRKGMADTLTKIGRNNGGLNGYLKLLQALLYDPFYGYSWRSLFEFSGRAVSKAKRELLQRGSNHSRSFQ